MARPTIALLYVGGSIGMQVNQKTGRIEPIESLNEIHRFLPELQKEVALKFFSISNVGSSEVTPELWAHIATAIQKLYDEFEGVVIIHGTNTMCYTAAALSFALQGLSKPVVLTGAVKPINDLTGDGRMNLIFAIHAAQLDLAEVCIVLGPRVLRGCRAKKVDQSYLRTFDTPTMAALADFGNGDLHLHPDRAVRRKRTLVCKPTFDPNVIAVTLTPGMPQTFLDSVLAAKPHGIVLRAFGPGMVPESLIPWLQKVTDAGIPMVATSQALRGTVDLNRYRKQLLLEEVGVIAGGNMTFETASVKLMWALAQADSTKRVHELMERNLVGEFS